MGGHVLRNPNTPKSFDTTHMHPSSIQCDVFCLLRLKFSRLGEEKKGWSGAEWFWKNEEGYGYGKDKHWVLLGLPGRDSA
jgi:hypothetical protein